MNRNSAPYACRITTGPVRSLHEGAIHQSIHDEVVINTGNSGRN